MIAVEQGAGGDHFGVQQGVAREQTQEVATVAVGPIHHGGNAEAAGGLQARCGGRFSYILYHFTLRVLYQFSGVFVGWAVSFTTLTMTFTVFAMTVIRVRKRAEEDVVT